MSDDGRAMRLAPKSTLKRRAGGLVAGCLAATLTASTTVGAQEATAERPPDQRWTFTVAPYLWATSLDGKASVGGVDADVDLPFSDILQDLAIGGMLLVDMQRGRFGIAVNGVFARLEPDGELGPIVLDVTNETTWIGVAPYFRAVEWTYRESASGRPLRFVVEPTAGIRYTNLRLELDGTGPRGNGRQVDQGESWVDPIVGSRFSSSSRRAGRSPARQISAASASARISPGTSRPSSATRSGS